MMGPQYYINNFSKEISDLAMDKLKKASQKSPG
jgi:hypothetical protein